MSRKRPAATSTGRRVRAAGVLAGVLVTLAGPAAAQSTPAPRTVPARPLCWWPREPLHCRVLVVSDVRAMARLTPQRSPAAGSDWGLMVNLGGGHAVGATASVTVASDGLWLTPTAHYWRWLGARTVLDLGVGRPVSGSQNETEGLRLPSASVSADLTVNARYGVFARADDVERSEVLACAPTGPCSFRVTRHVAWYAGAKLGGPPGAILSVTSALGVLVLIAIACSGGGCSS